MAENRLKRPQMEYIIDKIKSMEQDESRPLKRKRVVLTLEDKMNVILEKEKGNFEKIN